ncbi:MAG: RluA family pseudouridine synthase [Acidimicrobiia bacterium]|nr:RluA family pseudouridine synthase [Acidimicrobiia bacterium]
MADSFRYVVPADLDGERADKVVAVLGDMSRAEARAVVDSGDVTVGDSPVGPSTRLSAGTELTFAVPERPDILVPSEVALDLVYVDPHVVVVDKPSGLVVHPVGGRVQPSVAAGLLHAFPEIRGVGEDPRWGIVHRLDRDTSGLLVAARTNEAHKRLSSAIRRREIERDYLALVDGTFEVPRGTIDAPVAADPNRPRRRIVSPFGKPSRTHYRVRCGWPNMAVSLVDVTLETGRTHQIRVHFAAIEHPVIGDRWYGRPAKVDAPRVFLHAARLRFAHPVTGEPIDVSSPLPADLAGVLETLGEPG